MKLLAILFFVMWVCLLAGCSTTKEDKKKQGNGLDVRVNCSLPKDQLLVSSWWWGFAITVEASEKDRDIICSAPTDAP
jgi:hypothetical protein